MRGKAVLVDNGLHVFLGAGHAASFMPDTLGAQALQRSLPIQWQGCPVFFTHWLQSSSVHPQHLHDLFLNTTVTIFITILVAGE